MRALRPWAFVVLTVVLTTVVSCLLAASPARAGDEPAAPSAVERLTPQELEHLKRHVPDWDDLPADRRERIAENVLKIRNLSPEDRARFRERVERFRSEESALRERLPERLAHLAGKSRERFRVQAALASAVGKDLVRTLPDDARRAVAVATEGREGPKAAILGFAFSRALLEREAESMAQGAAVLAHVPSDDVRPRFEALVARVQAATAEDRPREMRLLAMLVVEDRARQAIKPLLARQGPRGDNASALVAAIRETFSDAWQATSADLTESARRGPGDLRRFLMRYGPKPERPDKARGLPRGAVFLLVRFLEQAGPWLAADPEARHRADRLLESVLVGGLGFPPAVLERLPSWDRPVERLRALKRLLLAR